MKYTVAAILALGVVPAYSLSYLESLSGAAPAIRSAAPAPAAEPPFFFTNGAKDEPAETPDFFFTNGSTSSAPATTSGYLSALNGAGNSVSGAGMRSYLDSLPKNAAPSVGGGAGLRSYTDNLSGGVASARPAFTPPPAAPAAPVVPSEPAAPVVAAGVNYLDALAKSSTSGAPTGAGLTSYLDALPRAPPTRGGAGIQSYTDNLPVANAFAGTGAGMTTYTDNLSGGRASTGKSFTPFVSKPSTSSSSASTGHFEFTINADPDMIAQIQAAGDRRVRLSGRASLN